MGRFSDVLDGVRKQLFRKAGQPVSVIFLVHNVTTLDCFLPLISKMLEDVRFRVRIASLNKKFPGDDIYNGEEAVHTELTRLGIEHIRLGMPDSMVGKSILKALNPDIIFRQSPWDDDIQEGYRTKNLGFTRLCYTPYYGIHIVDNGGKDFLHLDQRFHRHCWKIFVDPVTAEEYRQASRLHGSNVVVAGLTKYEYIWQCMQKEGTANRQNRSFEKRIIWAPHHSVSQEWFSFATFHHIYQYMLGYVEAHPKFHFIFRPHPAFYNNYIASGVLTKQELDAFYDRWRNLKNTSISENEDYGELFARSDAMITDGISFLASYQVTGRPLIWTRNKNHQKLTELGKKMTESTYIVDSTDIENLGKLLGLLLSDGTKDALKEKRKEFVEEYLLGKEEKPAEKIISMILTEFGFEPESEKLKGDK